MQRERESAGRKAELGNVKTGALIGRLGARRQQRIRRRRRTYQQSRFRRSLALSLCLLTRAAWSAARLFFLGTRRGERIGGKQVRFRTLGGETFRPKGPDTLHEKKSFRKKWGQAEEGQEARAGKSVDLSLFSLSRGETGQTTTGGKGEGNGGDENGPRGRQHCV